MSDGVVGMPPGRGAERLPEQGFQGLWPAGGQGTAVGGQQGQIPLQADHDGRFVRMAWPGFPAACTVPPPVAMT